MQIDLASPGSAAADVDEHLDELQPGQPHIAPGETTLRTVRTVAELAEIRSIWESWHRHPNSDIDFYSTIVELKPEIERPHVLLLYRDQSPRAMIVGRMERAFIECRFGYKVLYKRPARQLTFNYAGQLGDLSESASNALVQEIIASLRRGEADVAMFSFLKIDSPLFRAAMTLPGLWSRDRVIAKQHHRCMTVPRSMDQLNSQVSAKVRKNQRFKKLMKDFSGAWGVRCLRQPGEVERLCQDMEQVARNTYQRGLGVGFEDGAEMRRRLLLQSEKGWLRAYILYLGDKPAAFWLGTLYQTVLHSDCMGYDPEYAKYSPGMFLVMKVIEGLSGDGGEQQVSRIDWGLGDAEYKALLGTDDWQEASVYIFAPTLRGAALNTLRTPALMIEVYLKKILERTNLLGRIKRIWRDRLIRNAA